MAPLPDAPEALSRHAAPRRPSRTSVALVLLLALVTGLLGARCADESILETGHGLFLSAPVNPLALSEDGTRLYVANTASGTLSVVDVSDPAAPALLAEVPVGLEPTSVAVLPGGAGGDELVFVVNHLSDSISVVSRDRLEVVQTVQQVDADGVTTMNEPVAVAFAGPTRAFVTLDEPNQVLVLEIDEEGRARIADTRLSITAQAPRALAVRDGLLFVAAFESGNQTELPACAPGDDRGLLENDLAITDEGCEFDLEIIGGIDFSEGFQLGTIFQFAAVNPNIGGRVIRDRDLPDRDLFVFDAESLDPVDVVEGVGTLLNGLAVGPRGRVFVTNTDARNHLDGLNALGNRLFANRLSTVDCRPDCFNLRHFDLDAGAAVLSRGVTVPNPYGVQVSADGSTLVVTAKAADGDPGDGRLAMSGLFTLDANGHVLGSAVVGALPEGVALRSRPNGRPRTAFVLNGADASLSVVDVRNPESPSVLVESLPLGDDPTPPEIRRGRVAFTSARGSSTRTFSCESCHPNGNIDQLLWVINTPEGPDDGPAASGEHAEPRNTMPIRGLRDTLPLHWEGVLGDPFPGVNENQQAFDTAPDCEAPSLLDASGEVACARHLVDASLSGVMCEQSGEGCVPGAGQTGGEGSSLPGAYTDAERDAMAAFLLAVPYPPAPKRRPDDRLSEQALQGVSDFFTNEDGRGINNGIGDVVDFAPTTCADNPMGCHSLPLTVSTNSSIVGGFDAPSARGMWERFVMFSNGISSTEEVLRMSQDCADGIEPEPKTILVSFDGGGAIPVEVTGDPCNLRSDIIEQFLGVPLAELPFPSGETIYDPSVGMTERGSFLAIFEQLFSLVYGVRGENIWEYQVELSVGLPGMLGRQLTIDSRNESPAERSLFLQQLEDAATQGRVTARAHSTSLRVDMVYDAGARAWTSANGITATTEELEALVEDRPGAAITFTAHLPRNVSIGGADRQPLLDVDPDDRAAEQTGDAPTLPRPLAFTIETFRLGALYVDPEARVLVDGAWCESCSFVPGATSGGVPVIDLTLSPGLPAGVHVLQVLNPDGWASNEMPICVTDGVDVCVN